MILKLCLAGGAFIVSLFALNQTFDRQKLEAFKSFLISLWVEISDHSFPEGFNLINSRIMSFYKNTRLKLFKILAFVFVSLAVIYPAKFAIFSEFDSVIESTTIWAERINGVEIGGMLDMQKESRAFEIREKTNTRCLLPDHTFPENINFVDYERKFRILLENSKNLETSLRSFAEKDKLLFRGVSFIGESAAIMTSCCILSIGFWISTGLSMYLSQIFIRTNISVAIVFMLMITSAIAMPAAVSTAASMIYFAACNVYDLLGSISDILIYDNIGYANLIQLSYNRIFGGFYLLFNWPSIFLAAFIRGEGTIELGHMLVYYSWISFRNVFYIAYLLSINIYTYGVSGFSKIDINSTIINWTVLMDFTFSFMMVLSVTVNMLISKSQTSRVTLANIIQLVAESPQGPFIAVSSGISAVAFALLRWL